MSYLRICLVFAIAAVIGESEAVNSTVTYSAGYSSSSEISVSLSTSSMYPTSSSMVTLANTPSPSPGTPTPSQSPSPSPSIFSSTKSSSYSATSNHFTTSFMAQVSSSSRSVSVTSIQPSAASSVGIAVSSSTIQPVLQKTNITCEEDHMEITIDKNRYPNLDPDHFLLANKSCTSVVTGRLIKLRTALNGCGTTIEETKNVITYKNKVRAYNMSGQSSDDVITRLSDLELPFNCTYQKEKYVSSTSFKPIRRVDAMEGSFGNFTFIMDLYRTQSYTNKYGPSDYPISVKLNDPIYVRYQVKSTKGDLQVYAQKCLATTTYNQKSSPSYVFLDEGCPKDSTMDYTYIPDRVQNFSIDAFRFIADHPVVYIHCLLMVCHSNSNTSKCAVGCSSGNTHRPRREVSRDEESSSYHLSSGALTMKKVDKTSETPLGISTPVVILSSAVALLLVGCLVLVGFLLRRKRRTTAPTKPPLELEIYEYPVNIDDETD